MIVRRNIVCERRHHRRHRCRRRRVLVILVMLNVCSMLARDTDKMSGPFKERHVCFYHNFE